MIKSVAHGLHRLPLTLAVVAVLQATPAFAQEQEASSPESST